MHSIIFRVSARLVCAVAMPGSSRQRHRREATFLENVRDLLCFEGLGYRGPFRKRPVDDVDTVENEPPRVSRILEIHRVVSRIIPTVSDCADAATKAACT